MNNQKMQLQQAKQDLKEIKIALEMNLDMSQAELQEREKKIREKMAGPNGFSSETQTDALIMAKISLEDYIKSTETPVRVRGSARRRRTKLPVSTPEPAGIGETVHDQLRIALKYNFMDFSQQQIQERKAELRHQLDAGTYQPAEGASAEAVRKNQLDGMLLAQIHEEIAMRDQTGAMIQAAQEQHLITPDVFEMMQLGLLENPDMDYAALYKQYVGEEPMTMPDLNKQSTRQTQTGAATQNTQVRRGQTEEPVELPEETRAYLVQAHEWGLITEEQHNTMLTIQATSRTLKTARDLISQYASRDAYTQFLKLQELEKQHPSTKEEREQYALNGKKDRLENALRWGLISQEQRDNMLAALTADPTKTYMSLMKEFTSSETFTLAKRIQVIEAAARRIEIDNDRSHVDSRSNLIDDTQRDRLIALLIAEPTLSMASLFAKGLSSPVEPKKIRQFMTYINYRDSCPSFDEVVAFLKDEDDLRLAETLRNGQDNVITGDQLLVYLEMHRKFQETEEAGLNELKPREYKENPPRLSPQLQARGGGGNRCWCASLQYLLRSRGIELSLEEIFDVRPALHTDNIGAKYMEDMEDLYYCLENDRVFSISEMADVILRCLPNTAVAERNVYRDEDNFEITVRHLVTSIQAGLACNSPVAICNGSHYRSIVDMKPVQGRSTRGSLMDAYEIYYKDSYTRNAAEADRIHRVSLREFLMNGGYGNHERFTLTYLKDLQLKEDGSVADDLPLRYENGEYRKTSDEIDKIDPCALNDGVEFSDWNVPACTYSFPKQLQTGTGAA